MDISYIHEPTDLQCGQAVIAMVAGLTVGEVVSLLGNDRETDLREMRLALGHYGFTLSPQRIPVSDRSELPPLALLSLETPRCWHWSLYCSGTFYDPEHGVMDDFPASRRRFYWEITPAHPE
jgi:hypothetical protein